jgi:hypothetical protein
LPEQPAGAGHVDAREGFSNHGAKPIQNRSLSLLFCCFCVQAFVGKVVAKWLFIGALYWLHESLYQKCLLIVIFIFEEGSGG